MVGISRAFDLLEALEKRDFAPDADHPDADAGNEAETLARIFADAASTDEVKAKPADFRRWLDESVKASKDLSAAFERRARGDEDALRAAKDAFGTLRQRCDACHRRYRN
jgi:cytochrome c556